MSSVFVCPPLDHFDPMRVADFAQLGRIELVGDEGMDLGHVADAHRGCPVQLGAVANQQHAAGIVDNGSGTFTSRGS